MYGGTKVRIPRREPAPVGAPAGALGPRLANGTYASCNAYDWPKGYDPFYIDNITQEIGCRKAYNQEQAAKLMAENAKLDKLAATYADDANVLPFKGFPFLKGKGLGDPYGGCYGSALVGGRRRRVKKRVPKEEKKKARKKKTTKKGTPAQNRWQAHIRATLRAHPSLKHKRPELLKLASKTYKS
jgi:hypothetical protein